MNLLPVIILAWIYTIIINIGLYNLCCRPALVAQSWAFLRHVIINIGLYNLCCRPTLVAQSWAFLRHDLVVVCSIYGWGELFFQPLQKHVRKVVGGFGKKSYVSIGVRKPGNMCATDCHDMTLAVKVVLNPNITNQLMLSVDPNVDCLCWPEYYTSFHFTHFTFISNNPNKPVGECNTILSAYTK